MDVEYSGTTPLWGRDVSRPGKRGHARALQKGRRMGDGCGVRRHDAAVGPRRVAAGKARSCPRTPKGQRMGESAVMPAHSKKGAGM